MTTPRIDAFVPDAPVRLGLDVRPSGEPYFRHPGDAVRLVVWGTVAALLFLFIWLATATSEGVATDPW